MTDIEKEADEIDLDLSRIEARAERIVDGLRQGKLRNDWWSIAATIRLTRSKVRAHMNEKRRKET